MIRRYAAVLSIFAVALAFAALAAFGSGDAQAGAEARAKGAVAVPADALAYASVNTDRDGASWQSLEALAARVPGGADSLAALEAKLNGEGDESAVLRALGGDVSVGLLGIDLAGGMNAAADAIIVATAADGAALTGELGRMGFAEGPALSGTPVWEQGAFAIAIDGETVIGATSRATLREALETRAGQRPALADDPAFRVTLSRLPEDPLAVAYLSPARLAPLAEAARALVPQQESDSMPSVAGQLDELIAGLADVRGLGLAVSAEAGGLRLSVAGDADEAALAAMGARIPQAATPSIVERIPAEAVGFAAFRDLGPTLLAVIERAEADAPQLRDSIRSLEQATGLSLRDDLVPALSEQHALVALDGETPRGALLLAPRNPAAAGATLARVTSFLDIVDLLPEAGGSTLGKIGDIAVTTQRGGAVIAIGNAPELAAAPATPITDDPTYRAVTTAAGVPGAVTGLAYLNGAQLRAKATELAAKRGKDVPAALGAVQGIVAWGEPGGASLFIAVG